MTPAAPTLGVCQLFGAPPPHFRSISFKKYLIKNIVFSNTQATEAIYFHIFLYFLLFWGNFALTASIQICENCDDQKLWIFWIRCPIFIFRHYSFCRNYVLETNSHFGKKLVLPMKSAFYSFLFRCFRSKRNSKLMTNMLLSWSHLTFLNDLLMFLQLKIRISSNRWLL